MLTVGDSDIRFLLRVLLALGLGALIGLERDLADKPAGIRTHMLAAGSSTLLVLLGDIAVTQFGDNELSGLVQADPLRIFQAVVKHQVYLAIFRI